jgi:hypothetical protein
MVFFGAKMDKFRPAIIGTTWRSDGSPPQLRGRQSRGYSARERCMGACPHAQITDATSRCFAAEDSRLYTSAQVVEARVSRADNGCRLYTAPPVATGLPAPQVRWWPVHTVIDCTRSDGSQSRGYNAREKITARTRNFDASFL